MKNMKDAVRKLNLWIRISKVDLSKFYNIDFSRFGIIHLQGDFNIENRKYCDTFFSDYELEYNEKFKQLIYTREKRKYEFISKIKVTLI